MQIQKNRGMHRQILPKCPKSFPCASISDKPLAIFAAVLYYLNRRFCTKKCPGVFLPENIFFLLPKSIGILLPEKSENPSDIYQTTDKETRIIMWIADNWKDYEVIDTSCGEKLERWGKYILLRPDPQVIWNTPKEAEEWKHLNGHYHRSTKGGGEWEFFHLPDEWSIRYKELTFHLKPFSFKHTGLFPEQAVNWDWFSEIIKKANRPVKVLNLFAYTGGATLAAAKAGAAVTHVDASKGMVTWAKENAAASGLSDAPIRWLVDDCVKFVEREIRRGNTYDGIIMDPPSYGRGPKGEIWKIEESIYPFIELTTQLLNKDTLFFLINSYTTGLQPAVLNYMLNTTVVKKLGGHAEASEIGLPVSGNGLVLPCGASGRWMRD